MELTRINKLANAEIFLGSSHFNRLSTGERKMPPPIPTRPERNPIPPPSAPVTSGFTAFLCCIGAGWTHRRTEASRRHIPNRTKKKDTSFISHNPPMKAMGMLRQRKGHAFFRSSIPDRQKTY